MGVTGQPPTDLASKCEPSHPRNSLSVWHAATDRQHCGAFEIACEGMLSPEEIRDADRFRRITTRNQHVVGRAMARRLLGDGRVSPDKIRFSIGEHGKPFVSDPPEAKRPFNIAHTDGLVLCGVADGEIELVGVDVEATDRNTSSELAERFFSDPEVRYLRSLPLPRQQGCFLRIWTLKEAYIKAIGTGMQTRLSDFAFREIESDHPSIEFLSDELRDHRNWQFTCFEPRPGFIASAAVVTFAGDQPAPIHSRAFEPLVG